MAKFRTIVEDGLFLDLPDNDKVFSAGVGHPRLEHTALHITSDLYPPEAERSEVNLGSWHQDRNGLCARWSDRIRARPTR